LFQRSGKYPLAVSAFLAPHDAITLKVFDREHPELKGELAPGREGILSEYKS
jgi:hypothetical protein